MIYQTRNFTIRFACLALVLFFSLELRPVSDSATAFGGQRTRQNHSHVPDKKPIQHFERGEELLYEAEFTRALLRSIDVADFRFTARRIPLGEPGKPLGPSDKYSLKFDGEIKSKGFFSKLFNLNFLEQVTSIVEPGSFSLQTTKRFDQQGKRVRSSETVYDHSAGKLVWTEVDPRDPSRQPRVVTSPLPVQVQDILSGIYFLRTHSLEVGKSFQLSISDSGNVYHVPVRIVEKKRLKTVLGKLETVRADIELFGANGMIASKGEFSIWLTADERHIPVQARIKHEYGTFNIKLRKLVQNPAV